MSMDAYIGEKVPPGAFLKLVKSAQAFKVDLQGRQWFVLPFFGPGREGANNRYPILIETIIAKFAAILGNKSYDQRELYEALDHLEDLDQEFEEMYQKKWCCIRSFIPRATSNLAYWAAKIRGEQPQNQRHGLRIDRQVRQQNRFLNPRKHQRPHCEW